MEPIFKLLTNVKKGPITSVLGAVLLCFGGYLIYTSEQTTTYMSFEAGIFFGGIMLLVLPDKPKEDA